MNLNQDMRSISYLKAHLADVIKSVNKNHRPMVITQNGEASAVIQDVSTYEAVQKSVLLLKLIAQGELDIRQKRIRKHKDVIKLIEKKLRG